MAYRSDIPSRTPAGSLGCPRCSSRLEKKRAPFVLHGEYVGHFESLVCPICHFSVLTSDGYEKAIAEASRYGLVGPPEQMPVFQESEEQFAIVTNLKYTHANTVALFKESGKEERDLQSATHSAEIRLPEEFVIRRNKTLSMQVSSMASAIAK